MEIPADKAAEKLLADKKCKPGQSLKPAVQPWTTNPGQARKQHKPALYLSVPHTNKKAIHGRRD